MGLLAGCGGGSSDGKAVEPVPASSAAPSTADPDAGERAAVLEAYRAMAAAEVRTYASGALDAELERYATHTALADIKSTLFWYQQRGIVMKGEPVHSPGVDSLDTSGEPLRAVITDCVDFTGYDKVGKDGKPVGAAPSGPRRHVVTSSAQRTKSGSWLVYTSMVERDRSC
ncbi:hypothetical protein EDD91_7842 [Streptomyces sp. KS 21]|nr:hypothetical protein EDD91_7842 [Streptomyces sp. KS 21]